MKRDNFVLICFSCLALGVSAGMWIGHGFGIATGKLQGEIETDKQWRLNCVESGVAEFYLDDKYERRWRWKRDAPVEAVSSGRKRVPK